MKTRNNAIIKKYLNKSVLNGTIFSVIFHSKGVYVMADNKKNIVLRVDQDFHQQVKLYVTMNNTTLQDYIVGLIKKDMEQNKDKETK